MDVEKDVKVVKVEKDVKVVKVEKDVNVPWLLNPPETITTTNTKRYIYIK